MKSLNVTIQMKAIGQYFPVMLIKVVISTLASVNKVPNERYRVAVLFDTLCQMNFGNTKIKLSS